MTEKILLNRIYGFFITKGNRTAPPYYGQYIVQKGKNILLEIIRQIGLKDVIHSHTDSIKFVGSHEDVIEAYNKTIEFEELGKFSYEGTMEKVVYYNINKAKYIMDGELRFKHGGIAKEDIAPLTKLDYDQINENTEYEFTISWNYDDIKGFYGKTTRIKFGDKVKE